ncbi:MAG: hypothetical protein JOZ94_00540 [Xanthobacteraceae bacterium]|nr:hypothetical protein [Xanthobacteraceae bacterium]MBV9234293.1 hypothetical protein [Xanthobacteraceae bacterium]
MTSAASVAEVERDLAQIQAYWDRLRRGENSIPFSDDLRLTSLSDTAQHTLLIEVFHDPVRFRVDIAGPQIEKHYGAPFAGKFLDEIPARGPLDGLSAQCQSVLEARTPCFEAHKQQFARLILPFWGNGHIDMLLVAIASLGREPARN